jgi:plasmid stabilization system protein ParE
VGPSALRLARTRYRRVTVEERTITADDIPAVRKTVAQLAILPRAGHDGVVPGTFEEVLPRVPFIIVFRVDNDDGVRELVVLRVYHAAQER